MRNLWNNITVNVDYDEVIDQIPTSVLEEELATRKGLQRSDIKEFERQEQRRCGGIDIDINPEDYDLVDSEDISLSDFTIEQIIYYLEIQRCYTVISKSNMFGCLDNVATYLYNMPNYKFKEFLCNTLGISQRSTKEEIINEIKNRL